MAEETREVREGTTSPIVFQILSDGSALNLLSGYQVVFKMRDAKGQTYTYSSLDNPAKIVLSTTSTGVITFTPSSSNVFSYTKSPYEAYCWFYPSPASPTQKYSIPENEQVQIKVIKDY